MSKLYKVKIDDEVFLVEIEEVSQKPVIKYKEKPGKEKSEDISKKEEQKETIITTEKKQISRTYENKRVEESQKETNGKYITSPLPGKVTKVFVQPGTNVKKGDLLIVVEAMKMENEIFSNREGIIKEIFVRPGDMVEAYSKLLSFEE